MKGIQKSKGPHFYRQAYSAITDFGFYRSLLKQPFRKTLRFLLLLSAHIAVFLVVLYAWVYIPKLTDFVHWAERNFPPLEVRNGQLTVDGDQPLIQRYQGAEVWSFVFDTLGTYTSPHGLEGNVVLMTRENLIVRVQGQTQTYRWREFASFAVLPEDWPGIGRALRWLFFPFGYSVALTLTLLTKALQALVLTPIALLVGTRYAIRLSLKNGFTIALYSLVPAIVIDLGVKATGIEISYFDLIYLAIGAIYTYLATQRSLIIE